MVFLDKAKEFFGVSSMENTFSNRKKMKRPKDEVEDLKQEWLMAWEQFNSAELEGVESFIYNLKAKENAYNNALIKYKRDFPTIEINIVRESLYTKKELPS